MNGKTILVLGGGVGGVVTANALREHLASEHRIVVVDKRAEYLFKAAKIIRDRKFEFGAWMVYEVGKNWAEADADVAETIDFLEFYGREAIRYAEKQPLTPIENEANELEYIPLGIGAVIPPWNFPLAIMAGMTTASLVAGNTVLLAVVGAIIAVLLIGVIVVETR